MKWKYYYRTSDGKILKSDDIPSDLPEGTPKITLASLSWGIPEEVIEKSKNFLIGQNCLVRVPVFNENGIESEMQHRGYDLYQVSPEPNSPFGFGMSPKEAGDVILESMKDGFDIATTEGGLGLTNACPYVVEHVINHPQEFIGKPKVRFFGNSNATSSVMLHGLVQYVHMPFLKVMAYNFPNLSPNLQKALSIIKGDSAEFEREAHPQNEIAKEFLNKGKSLEKLTCYPFNISSVFDYLNNSIWPFVPPQDAEYSLIIETIAYNRDPLKSDQALQKFRWFLQDLKNRGQKLPIMIEVGDITPDGFNGHVYEHGLMLNISELRNKKFDENEEKNTKIVNTKIDALKKDIVKRLKEDQELAKQFGISDSKNLTTLSDEQANDFIEKHVRAFCQEYLKAFQTIAEEFKIALFTGGERRIGHGFYNPVTASGSQNNIELSGNGSFLAIKSGLDPLEKTIQNQDIESLALSKRRIENCVPEIKIEVVQPQNSNLSLKLKALNPASDHFAESLTKSSAILTSNNVHSLIKFETNQPKCWVFNSDSLQGLSILLEQSLLMGRLGSNELISEKFTRQTPAIIIALFDEDKNGKVSEEKFKEYYDKAKAMIGKFIEYNKISVPIYLAETPIVKSEVPLNTPENPEKIFTYSPSFEIEKHDPAPDMAVIHKRINLAEETKTDCLDH